MSDSDAIESTNTNPIHPSVPDDDFLADSVPHCGLDGECESCQ